MKKNYAIIFLVALMLAACGQKKTDTHTFIRQVKTATVDSSTEFNIDFSG